MLRSTVCRYEHFLSDWYQIWSQKLPLSHYGLDSSTRPQRPHRKAWEWCAIAQALEEHDMLRSGRTGCGFAVGTEPLAAAFAARGVDILATDQPLTDEALAWTNTGQHAASMEALFRPELLDRQTFDLRVRFRSVDMRNPNLPWPEKFDFVWSSCSIEHIGGLDNGMAFVEAATELLAPGGVAVHTTEFNVGSNDATLTTGDSVIYRRRDIEDLDRALRPLRCGLVVCDFDPGVHPFDLNFDVPPYGNPSRQHVKLQLGGHIATSILLIVRKA